MRILFIGNSYTYVHNLPDVRAALAAGAAPTRQLHVEMEVRGGATLQQHWTRSTALARIEDGALRFTVADPRFLAPSIRHRAVWRAGGG